MTEHYEGRVLLGIVHPMAFPETIKGEGPVIETIEKIALDDFFGAIEVRRAVSPAIREAEKRIFEETAIEVVVAGQPPLLLGKLSLNDLDETGRQAAVDDVKKSIDEAYEIGARLVAILSGPDPGDADRPKAMDAITRSLVEAATYAAKTADGRPPVHVSLETFDRTIDKKCLIGPTPLACELMAKVKESVDNVGLTVDLSHQPLLNETAQEMVGGAKEHLIHVHAGNAYFDRAEDPAYGDQHPRFGYPGSANGVAALTEFLGVLKDIGYYDALVPTRRPILTFEVKPVPGESSDAIIAGTKRVFKEAWSAA